MQFTKATDAALFTPAQNGNLFAVDLRGIAADGMIKGRGTVK